MRNIIGCLLICLICSCNWRSKRMHPTDVPAQRPHLMGLVRSYEPAIYEGKVPKAFYDYLGAWDFWRYPVVFPYAIGCIDVTSYGFLYSNRETKDYKASGGIDQISGYFDKFIFDRSYFVGSKCRTPFDKDSTRLVGQYFLFSFADSAMEDINGAAALRKRLKTLRFSGDTTFMTIDEYAAGL